MMKLIVCVCSVMLLVEPVNAQAGDGIAVYEKLLELLRGQVGTFGADEALTDVRYPWGGRCEARKHLVSVVRHGAVAGASFGLIRPGVNYVLIDGCTSELQKKLQDSNVLHGGLSLNIILQVMAHMCYDIQSGTVRNALDKDHWSTTWSSGRQLSFTAKKHGGTCHYSRLFEKPVSEDRLEQNISGLAGKPFLARAFFFGALCSGTIGAVVARFFLTRARKTALLVDDVELCE